MWRYCQSWQQQVVNCGFVAYCVAWSTWAFSEMLEVCFTIVTLCLFACLLGVPRVFVALPKRMQASAAAMGGELHFLEACFVSILAIRDLTPNTGLFWYLFTEACRDLEDVLAQELRSSSATTRSSPLPFTPTSSSTPC